MTAPSTRRPTARSLPIALLRAREQVMAPFRPLLAKAGVTEAQWRVLRVLEENGRLDPTRTAQAACVLLPSLTRIVRDLETRALVRRVPHDSDRRTFWLETTEAARRLISDHIAESDALFAELEARMGAAQMTQLLDLLEVLQEADEGGGAPGTDQAVARPAD